MAIRIHLSRGMGVGEISVSDLILSQAIKIFLRSAEEVVSTHRGAAPSSVSPVRIQ